MKVLMPNGVRCIYCGAVFPDNGIHPPAIEFVNGYPVLCRRVGRTTLQYHLPDGDYDVWLETNRVEVEA